MREVSISLCSVVAILPASVGIITSLVFLKSNNLKSHFQPSQLTARQRALGGEDAGILSQVISRSILKVKASTQIDAKAVSNDCIQA